MESTDRFYKKIKTKHLGYSLLLAAAFSWPWIWMAAIGSTGEGDLVDLISLGMFPVIIIGAFILYKETKSRPASYRWAFSVALAAALLIVWITPAVGIYGHSGDPADLPYYGVLTVGIIGALITRFRPRGMALTLAAMAIAQMLVEVIGMTAGLGSRLILNGFFAALWIGSALLFWHAARGQATSQKPDRNNTSHSST